MTENNILFELECCSTKGCHKCPRQGKVGCTDSLAKDALTIVKMQKERLEGYNEELHKLETTNRRLQTVCRYEFTPETLVKAVNGIIKACMDEDSGLVEKIAAIENLARVTNLKCFVGLHPGDPAPEIILKK
jgi:hypothetical protein